jgi:hypothetical protein
MTAKIERMLEKLAEMFPKQDYQRCLEQYITSRKPSNVGDVEHYEREFYRKQTQGFL